MRGLTPHANPEQFSPAEQHEATATDHVGAIVLLYAGTIRAA